VLTPLVTVTEAASLLASMGLTLTPRQVRYLGLAPVQRASGRNGGRLYDPIDVTLLAVFSVLLARVRTWGLPAWSARAAIRYRERDLRRAIQRQAPRFLVVDALRGTAALSETADTRETAIDIRALARAVFVGVRDVRAEEPEVWTGAERVPLEELQLTD
jgi:hypothetical protein